MLLKKQEDLSGLFFFFASSLGLHIQTSYFSMKTFLSKIIYPSAVLYLHFSATKGELGTSSSPYLWSTWVIGSGSEHVSSCIYGYLWSSLLERWTCFVSEDCAELIFLKTCGFGHHRQVVHKCTASQMGIRVSQCLTEKTCSNVISPGGKNIRLGRPGLCLAAPTSLWSSQTALGLWFLSAGDVTPQQPSYPDISRSHFLKA